MLLLFVVCYVLFVVRCVLIVVCCSLFAVCSSDLYVRDRFLCWLVVVFSLLCGLLVCVVSCVLFVGCGLWFAVSGLLFVVCGLLSVARCSLFVARRSCLALLFVVCR